MTSRIGPVLVFAVSIVLAGVATAHADKRLTTGMSSSSADFTECRVVNTSSTKTITLDLRLYNHTGTPVASVHTVLSPFQRASAGYAGGELWCEITVVSRGSTKDLRGNMTVIDAGTVAAMEPARDK